MVNNPELNHIDLETFLKSAGQSLTDAQKKLVPGIEVPVNMMLSNAELELKVTVSSDAKGKMSIRPVSSEDLVRGGIDSGMLSTIRISFVSSIGDIKTESQLISTSDNIVKGDNVPNLIGLTLEAAIKLLKSSGWQYEPHAARSSDITTAAKENTGCILRQQPTQGQVVDKTNTVLEFWVDLGNTLVSEIDGIGIKTSDNLGKIGISTVGELSLANVKQVAEALQISESRAQSYLDMAGLMSRLAILGFKDEVVELIVKGANIRSIEQLSNFDPKTLYNICLESVKSGKVKTPRGFSFTLDNIKSWIKAATDYLSK
jgi:hypothetical protein